MKRLYFFLFSFLYILLVRFSLTTFFARRRAHWAEQDTGLGTYTLLLHCCSWEYLPTCLSTCLSSLYTNTLQ